MARMGALLVVGVSQRVVTLGKAVSPPCILAMSLTHEFAVRMQSPPSPPCLMKTPLAVGWPQARGLTVDLL